MAEGAVKLFERERGRERQQKGQQPIKKYDQQQQREEALADKVSNIDGLTLAKAREQASLVTQKVRQPSSSSGSSRPGAQTNISKNSRDVTNTKQVAGKESKPERKNSDSTSEGLPRFSRRPISSGLRPPGWATPEKGVALARTQIGSQTKELASGEELKDVASESKLENVAMRPPSSMTPGKAKRRAQGGGSHIPSSTEDSGTESDTEPLVATKLTFPFPRPAPASALYGPRISKVVSPTKTLKTRGSGKKVGDKEHTNVSDDIDTDIERTAMVRTVETPQSSPTSQMKLPSPTKTPKSLSGTLMKPPMHPNMSPPPTPKSGFGFKSPPGSISMKSKLPPNL
jgi:hypothetical protein